MGRADLQLDARTSLSLATGSSGRRDLMGRLEGRFRARPQWLLRLALEIFTVDNRGYFGLWQNNDRLIAAIEYRP